jgi:hypothetical protein
MKKVFDAGGPSGGLAVEGVRDGMYTVCGEDGS